MKKLSLLTTLAVITLIFITSCVGKDDFDDLKKQVNKNTSEINKLSKLTDLLDEAIQNGELITDVNNTTKIVDGKTVNGLEIIFSGDGDTKYVWNGTQGDQGEQGPQGDKGKDGVAVTENTLIYG